MLILVRQGNQPEQNATVGIEGTGTEPPSGQQGSGTINEPYDGGNQPGTLRLSTAYHVD